MLGPFHVADAPELPMGANICLDQKGEPMFVHGRILDTEGKPIADAKIDVWQANDEGFYDVQQKGIQPDFNLRGVFRTGADGTLLVPRREAEVLPDPRRRPGRQAARRARPPSLPAGASALHRRGRRLRAADHPHLRSRRSLHQFRRGVRREGEPARRVPARSTTRRARRSSSSRRRSGRSSTISCWRGAGPERA